MCLLKSNDRNSVCNHEECKQLSMVNRQGCLFSLKHPKNQDMFANPFNLIQPSQLHDPKAHVSPQQYHNTQPVNHRGVEKVTHEIDRDDEPFVLNKKKFKADDSHASSADARTRNTIFTPYQSSHSGSNQADRMVFNKPLLNNLLINANNSVEQKQPNVQYVPINQPIYMPLMQGNGVQTPNLMGNQQIAFIQVPQNTQMPVQNIAQQFKTRANEPMGGYFSPSKSNSNSNSSGENSSIEEMMRSMQEKLTEMLFTQNKMITDLREKNELVQDTLACLINEVCDLKQVVKKNSGTAKGFDGYDPKPLLLQTGVADSGRETANTDSLLNFLYAGKQDFQYQLVFKNELPLPLYRERNFKFTVLLTDKDGNVVKNANRIPLTLAMYTSENPPKFIDVNTAGNKVLKGMIDRDLVDGVARFDKIQINEVTSHFRNGWVFFVVYAKNSGVVLNNFVANNGMAAISHQQIKPLIMEKIVVKAKRAKEREQNAQQDELDNKDELNCHNNMMFEMRPELEDHSNIFIQTEN